MTVMTRPQMRAECLAQTDRGRSLAFAERGGGDGGHIDVLAVRAFRRVEDLALTFALYGPNSSNSFSRMPSSAAICKNWFELSCLCDLDVGWYRAQEFEFGRSKWNFFPLVDIVLPTFC